MYRRFSGRDQGVSALSSRDRSITEAYHALGSRQTGRFEEYYKTWVGGHVTEIIEDDSIRRQRFERRRAVGGRPACRTYCVEKFEDVRDSTKTRWSG